MRMWVMTMTLICDEIDGYTDAADVDDEGGDHDDEYNDDDDEARMGSHASHDTCRMRCCQTRC